MEDRCKSVRRAAELARIAFTPEEMERLCKEASRIAEYLASVGEAVRGLEVEPLYHVWEEEGGLRDRIEDRRVALESFLPPERLDGEGRVRVPWREVK